MADETKQKPAKEPKKPWYKKLRNAVGKLRDSAGTAIGEAKFGGR